MAKTFRHTILTPQQRFKKVVPILKWLGEVGIYYELEKEVITIKFPTEDVVEEEEAKEEKTK